MTNLDIAKKYFKNAEFHNDVYRLDDEWYIVWIESERFIVDRTHLDEVGWVTDEDIFTGDFRQCLEFCLGEKIDHQDFLTLESFK